MGVYFNRDLSWIDFNERVLEEGLNAALPPLERFKFLSIAANNFDEFFMVRVAALKAALWQDSVPPDPSGLSYRTILAMGAEKVRSIICRLYACLENEIFPALAAGGLELVRPGAYSAADKDLLESLFMQELSPILTPLRLNDEQRPSIGSNCLYAAFLLSPESGGDSDSSSRKNISIVKIPSSIDRVIWLSPEKNRSEKARFAFFEDTVQIWGAYLYPGFRISESMLFKINRDANFSVDEKRDEDFVEAMTEVIEGRETSTAVRMVYSPGSKALKERIAAFLALEEADLYEVPGPLQLGDLTSLINVSGFDHLREKPWHIYQHPAFAPSSDDSIFDLIRSRDILLHLPYQHFEPVLKFFQAAATDPDVIAIKTALYRTSGDSPIVKALEQAAMNGKQVTAVVELKARFDEERNISWANRLEKAGVIVVYGLSNLKVHAKVSIVMRKEMVGMTRYIHLSTGNYNDKTAKLYEDIGLFTVNDEIAFDAGVLFNMLTGYSVLQPMRRLAIAPVTLKHRLLDLIEREAARSNQAYPGRIMAKMNALADTGIINALYRASQAGVQIDLTIRGICMLVPGVSGLSENIRVRSVIDHYLEHSRIFYFANGGAEELFLSSADWMPRNLERRVELLFPVLEEGLRQELIASLETYFKDTCQARALKQDGQWERRSPLPGEKPFRVQKVLLNEAREAAEKPLSTQETFIVRRSLPGGLCT